MAEDVAGEPAKGSGGVVSAGYDQPRMDLVILAAGTQLGGGRMATQDIVYRGGDVLMHRHLLPAFLLDEDIEGGRGLALEDGLLGAAAAGLLVA
jgi:hypothetical protein